MNFSKEEMYLFASAVRVYYSLISAMTGFAFPKEILTTDVIVILLKALLLNPCDEKNDLSASSRTKHTFSKGPIACKAPSVCEPGTAVLLSDLNFGEVEHARKLAKAT